MIIFCQVRIELIRFTSYKPIEPVIALLQRPLALIGTGGEISLRNIMVFAEPESTPTIIIEYLRHGDGLWRQLATIARKPICSFRNSTHSVEIMIAAGIDTGACWGAQGNSMPLGVGQSVSSKLVHGGHVDPSAVWRPGSEPCIVVQDEQDVG